MGLFIFGIVMLIIGVIVLVAMRLSEKAKAKKLSWIPMTVCVIICLFCTVFSSIVSVPTGHTGILVTFGQVENRTFEAGIHIKAPWQDVVIMDNRNQKATLDLLCFSSDIQEVQVVYTLNYQIEKANAQNIYKTLGANYYDVVIVSRIQEAVKSVVAKYTAEELLDSRAELSQQIKQILVDKLSTYNIEVVDTSLENLDFSDAFTDAVEAKQVAEQKSKQAQIEQAQKTMEAEAEAERSRINAEAAAAIAKIAAEADLDVVKIQADAAEYAGQKDAAVIGQVLRIFAVDPDNVTAEDVRNLLLYYYILEWDGKLPETYVGSEDFYSMLAALAIKSYETVETEIPTETETLIETEAETTVA